MIAAMLVWQCDMNVSQANSKATSRCSFKWQKPRGQPRTRWQNYVEELAWSHLGIPPAELPLVAGDRDAWRCQFELLPHNPKRISRQRKMH